MSFAARVFVKIETVLCVPTWKVLDVSVHHPKSFYIQYRVLSDVLAPCF